MFQNLHTAIILITCEMPLEEIKIGIVPCSKCKKIKEHIQNELLFPQSLVWEKNRSRALLGCNICFDSFSFCAN